MPGILMILVGLFWGWGTNVFRRIPDRAETTGTVVSSKWKERRHDDCGYHDTYENVIEYIVDGKTYRARWRADFSGKGKPIPIVYSQANPHVAFIKPRLIHYLVTTVFIVSGVLTVYSIFVSPIEWFDALWGG